MQCEDKKKARNYVYHLGLKKSSFMFKYEQSLSSPGTILWSELEFHLVEWSRISSVVTAIT